MYVYMSLYMCIASKYYHIPLCYGGVAAKTSPRAAPKFALIDRPREVVGSSRLERALKQTNISTSDPKSYAKILV